MLICIKDCYPKYNRKGWSYTTLAALSGRDNYYIPANSLFSKYYRSINPDTEEPSWTICSELFPEIEGVVYDFENFMTLEDWRNLKINKILC